MIHGFRARVYSQGMPSFHFVPATKMEDKMEAIGRVGLLQALLA